MTAKNSHTPLLEEIAQLLLTGNGTQARKQLSLLTQRKLQRNAAFRAAQLAHNATLPHLAIRILNPVVRSRTKLLVEASPQEKALYAACLTRIGASQEALGILRELNANKVPERLLYEAYALFTQWNYRDAIPLLKQYSTASGLDDFQRIIGKVNLAAAYVHEQNSKAVDSLLGELRDITEEKGLLQWFGNCLELSAQHAIFNRDWKSAEHHLKRAEKALEKTGGLYQFFVRKWRAVAKALQNSKKTEALLKIREESTLLKHWESTRDCDRFLSLATKNDALLLHLYVGTPHEEFRKHLLADYPRKVSLPDSYTWHLEKLPRQSARIATLNLSSPSFHKVPMKDGQILHRLLLALSADFYRPVRIASLHSSLYPGDYFNPVSSPTRVHQIMKRVREWLKANRIPLHIREDHGAYALKATQPTDIIVSLSAASHRSRPHFLLKRLREIYINESFTAREAAKSLPISQRSAVRLLSESHSAGIVIREGAASRTRYRF